MSTRYDERDYGRYDRDDESYREGSPERRRFGREGDYERYGRQGWSGRSEYDRESEYRARGGKAGWPLERERAGVGEPLYNTGRAFGGRLYGSNPALGNWEDEEQNSYREQSRGSYRDPSRRYFQRYNYPSGYRSGETYDRSYRSSEYDRDYDRDYDLSRRGERGWLDRASDEVSSWFGDEEAERRRRLDKMREGNYRGRGPRGYKRSDERIKEDINDRLSDDSYIDASDIEVTVASCEVTLTGSVDDRHAKRRAEDIAEDVSGVANVENRLRIRGRTIEGATTTEPTHGSALSRMAAAGAGGSSTSTSGTSTSIGERNRTTT
ncbi:MAG TPA: BON domain-containing protein [Pyrinomonadaceae bacterium]|nr:BON domain-containing protein [Pyrinomonadaceae bacterium]